MKLKTRLIKIALMLFVASSGSAQEAQLKLSPDEIATRAMTLLNSIQEFQPIYNFQRATGQKIYFMGGIVRSVIHKVMTDPTFSIHEPHSIFEIVFSKEIDLDLVFKTKESLDAFKNSLPEIRGDLATFESWNGLVNMGGIAIDRLLLSNESWIDPLNSLESISDFKLKMTILTASEWSSSENMQVANYNSMSRLTEIFRVARVHIELQELSVESLDIQKLVEEFLKNDVEPAKNWKETKLTLRKSYKSYRELTKLVQRCNGNMDLLVDTLERLNISDILLYLKISLPLTGIEKENLKKCKSFLSLNNAQKKVFNQITDTNFGIINKFTFNVCDIYLRGKGQPWFNSLSIIF